MTRSETFFRWANRVLVVAGAILAVGFVMDGAWWRAGAFTLLTGYYVHVTVRDVRRPRTRVPDAPQPPG